MANLYPPDWIKRCEGISKAYLGSHLWGPFQQLKEDAPGCVQHHPMGWELDLDEKVKSGRGGDGSNKGCQHSLLSACVCWNGRSLQAHCPYSNELPLHLGHCAELSLLNWKSEKKCFPEVSSMGNLSLQWEKWWHTFLKCKWMYFVMVLGKYGSSQWYLNVNVGSQSTKTTS